LHSCPANSESKYFVQVLHNEHPILMAVYFSSSRADYAYDFVCFLDMYFY
jgi:hypothetical protein